MRRVEHRHQQFRHLRAHAAAALGQHVRAQQQHAAHLGLAQRLAHAAAVAAHQVLLQRRHLIRCHPHIGQLPKAGVDAVRRRIPGGSAIDHSA